MAHAMPAGHAHQRRTSLSTKQKIKHTHHPSAERVARDRRIIRVSYSTADLWVWRIILYKKVRLCTMTKIYSEIHRGLRRWHLHDRCSDRQSQRWPREHLL